MKDSVSTLSPVDLAYLAKYAYSAYSDSVGGKSVTDAKIPAWDENSNEKVKDGWKHVVFEVSRKLVNTYKFRLPLRWFGETWKEKISEPRLVKEIEFACMYAESFKHGTDGHGRLILISEMANLLDEQQERIAKLEGILKSEGYSIDDNS